MAWSSGCCFWVSFRAVADQHLEIHLAEQEEINFVSNFRIQSLNIRIRSMVIRVQEEGITMKGLETRRISTINRRR